MTLEMNQCLLTSLELCVNTPSHLKNTRNNSGIWLRFQKLLCKGTGQHRGRCCAGGCPSLLLRTICEAIPCQGGQGTCQGLNWGLATVTTETSNKKKKIREEVATGHCVPVAGRSEISCAPLWVNKGSTTDGCWTES